MWSQLDQATGSYRLVKSVDGGAPAPVAVPERAGGPFDIDLGTNRSGSTYAVYTRDGDIYRLERRQRRRDEDHQAQLADPGRARPDHPARRDRLHPPRRRLRPAAHRRHDERVEGQPLPGQEALDRWAPSWRSSRSPTSSSPAAATVVHVRNIAHRPRPGRLPRDLGRRELRRRHAADLRRRTPTPSSGRARTSARAPATASCATRCRARSSPTRQGSPRYNATAWAGAQLGAATSSSLDGGDGVNSCDDAGVHYCQVTVTGPLSFTLKP